MKQYYIVALIVIATLLLTNCKKAGSGDENPQETFDPTPLESADQCSLPTRHSTPADIRLD